MKKELTVNSSMKEFEKSIKELRLTLPEAQCIGDLIYDARARYKSKIEGLCEKCYNKQRRSDEPTFASYKKKMKGEFEQLEKLNKRFYPYIKYDW